MKSWRSRSRKKGMEAPAPPMGKVFSVFTDQHGLTWHFSFDIVIDLIILLDSKGTETAYRGTFLEGYLGPTQHLISDAKGKGRKLRFEPKDLWLEACFESSRRMRASHSTAALKPYVYHGDKETKESGPAGRGAYGKRGKRHPERDFEAE